MSKTLAIAERELKSYFVSPVAYTIAAIFLLVTGYLFSLILVHTREASMRILFSNLTVTFLLITPALTMRLFAEEKRSGTIDLLYTSPITDLELVAGKYLASCVFLLFLLGCTAYCPLMLAWLGNPDWATVWTGYLGLYLIGISFLAVGLLASSWTDNQVVAAILTFGLCIMLWLSSAAAGAVGEGLGDFLSYLSPIVHLDNLNRGVLDTQDFLYFFSFIFFMCFLTWRSIEAHHWR